jgi:hypothetical protein
VNLDEIRARFGVGQIRSEPELALADPVDDPVSVQSAESTDLTLTVSAIDLMDPKLTDDFAQSLVLKLEQLGWDQPAIACLPDPSATGTHYWTISVGGVASAPVGADRRGDGAKKHLWEYRMKATRLPGETEFEFYLERPPQNMSVNRDVQKKD